MFSSQGYVCHFHQVMQLYIHPGLSRGRPHKKAYMIVFKFRIGSKLEPQKKSETAEKQGLKKHCCWNERMRLNYIHWSMSLLHGGPRCDPVQTSDIWCKHNVSIYNEETFGSHISAKHWTWNTTAWAVLDFSARQMCLAWSETVVLPSWNLTTIYFSSIWFCSLSWKLIPILSARCRFDGGSTNKLTSSQDRDSHPSQTWPLGNRTSRRTSRRYLPQTHPPGLKTRPRDLSQLPLPRTPWLDPHPQMLKDPLEEPPSVAEPAAIRVSEKEPCECFQQKIQNWSAILYIEYIALYNS